MFINPSAVYVIAPQGAGKSTHARAIAGMFGCSNVIVDDWDGISEVPDDALVLAQPSVFERLAIAQAG